MCKNIVLQLFHLNRESTGASLCPDKAFFIKTLVVYREDMLMILSRRQNCSCILLHRSLLGSSGCKVNFMTIFLGNKFIVLLVSQGVMRGRLHVRVLQSLSGYNGGKQLKPPRESLAFNALSFFRFSPLFFFSICLLAEGQKGNLKQIISACSFESSKQTSTCNQACDAW